MRRYTAVLLPDPREGGFAVKVPALRECVTQGETVAHALANARDVIRLYFYDLACHGETVPKEQEAVLLHVTAVEVWS
jgi:predicted RNase H-like HicB family nuclease